MFVIATVLPTGNVVILDAVVTVRLATFPFGAKPARMVETCPEMVTVPLFAAAESGARYVARLDKMKFAEVWFVTVATELTKLESVVSMALSTDSEAVSTTGFGRTVGGEMMLA